MPAVAVAVGSFPASPPFTSMALASCLGFLNTLESKTTAEASVDDDLSTWTADGATPTDNGDGTYTLTAASGNYQVTYASGAQQDHKSALQFQVKLGVGTALLDVCAAGTDGTDYTQYNLSTGAIVSDNGDATGSITGPDGDGYYTVTTTDADSTTGTVTLGFAGTFSASDTFLIRNIQTVVQTRLYAHESRSPATLDTLQAADANEPAVVTAVGAPWVDGVSTGIPGFEYDGGNDHDDSTSALSDTNCLHDGTGGTIVLDLACGEATPAASASIASTANTAAHVGIRLQQYSTGQLSARVSDGSSVIAGAVTTGSVTADRRMLVAYRFDSTSLLLNTEDSTGTEDNASDLAPGTPSASDSTYALAFGATTAGASPWKGTIFNRRVFSSKLSDTELALVFDELKRLSGGAY